MADSFPEREFPSGPSISYKLSSDLSHRSTDWRMILLNNHICWFLPSLFILTVAFKFPYFYHKALYRSSKSQKIFFLKKQFQSESLSKYNKAKNVHKHCHSYVNVILRVTLPHHEKQKWEEWNRTCYIERETNDFRSLQHTAIYSSGKRIWIHSELLIYLAASIWLY